MQNPSPLATEFLSLFPSLMAMNFAFCHHPAPPIFPVKKKYAAISVADSIVNDVRRQVLGDERKYDRSVANSVISVKILSLINLILH